MQRFALMATLVFAVHCSAQASSKDTSAIVAALDKIESSTEDDITQLRTWLAETESKEFYTHTRVQLKLASVLWQSGQSEESEALIAEVEQRFEALSRELKIRLLMTKANYEHYRNNYFEAEQLSKTRILPLAEPDSPLLAKAYHNLGLYVRYQMKLPEAKRYYDKAVAQFELNDNQLGKARAIASLGVLYETQGNLSKATEYQQRARLIFEKVGVPADIAANYYNIGELYYLSNDYEASLMFYKKALELDLTLNNQLDIAYDHHRIATVYLVLNDLTNALQHNQQAIAIFIKLDAQQVLSRGYLQQAKIHQLMEQNDNRLESILLAKGAADNADTDHQTRAVIHALGEYYFDLGEFEQSQSYLHQALAIADKLAMKTHQFTDHNLLAQIESKLENYEEAFYHAERALELEKDLNSDQQIKEREKYKRDINLLEEKIKVTELEKQHALNEQLLDAEKAKGQIRLLILVALLSVFLAVVYMLLQRRKLALLKADLYKDSLEQKDQLLADVSHELRTPLTALKLQIDALQHNLVKDVDASYQKLSTKVMDINRLISDIYQLAQTDTGALTLNKSEQLVRERLEQWLPEFKDFAQSQGLELQHDIQLADTKLIFDAERIKQVLANLISNSCFYTDKPGSIKLSAYVKYHYVFFVVEDSSPGVAENEREKIFNRLYRVEQSRSRQTGGSGLGLAICESLIKAHGGKMRAEESELGGLLIRIRLPLS